MDYANVFNDTEPKRSLYSIYYTNQMHIISRIWVLNT
jgi:hypothetical protein